MFKRKCNGVFLICARLIVLVCISAHGGVLCIVDVHCHVKFYAIYRFEAYGRKFYVVFIHVLILLLVDHFG